MKIPQEQIDWLNNAYGDILEGNTIFEHDYIVCAILDCEEKEYFELAIMLKEKLNNISIDN